MNLFGMGDSISHGYHPYLVKMLPAFIHYTRTTGDPGDLDNPTGSNNGNSAMVLDDLTRRLHEPAFKPDYLLLNCGLHDIRQDAGTKTLAIPIDTYRKNLQAVLDVLTRREIGLIWINTTPVDDATHLKHTQTFERRNENVLRYNEAAATMLEGRARLMIDLYTFTRQLGADGIPLYHDHVHFHKEVCRLQAAYIAGTITGFFSL